MDNKYLPTKNHAVLQVCLKTVLLEVLWNHKTLELEGLSEFKPSLPCKNLIPSLVRLPGVRFPAASFRLQTGFLAGFLEAPTGDC